MWTEKNSEKKNENKNWLVQLQHKKSMPLRQYEAHKIPVMVVMESRGGVMVKL